MSAPKTPVSLDHFPFKKEEKTFLTWFEITSTKTLTFKPFQQQQIVRNTFYILSTYVHRSEISLTKNI